MMQLFKGSILIAFITFQLIANGQTVDHDSLTTEELNDHVTLLLKNMRIYKKLLRQDQHGDSAIYVKVERFQKLLRDEPFINDGVKYYYWAASNLFFFNITPPWLGLVKYSHNWYDTRYTFIADDLYIEMQILHVDMKTNERISPDINQLKISNIKRLN